MMEHLLFNPLNHKSHMVDTEVEMDTEHKESVAIL